MGKTIKCTLSQKSIQKAIDEIKNYTSINKYDIQLLDNVKHFLSENNFKYVDKYEEFLDKAKKMYSIYEEKSKYIANVDITSSEMIEKIIKSAISKNEKVDNYIRKYNYRLCHNAQK